MYFAWGGAIIDGEIHSSDGNILDAVFSSTTEASGTLKVCDSSCFPCVNRTLSWTASHTP